MHVGQHEHIHSDFYNYRRNQKISAYHNIEFINYTCTFKITDSNVPSPMSWNGLFAFLTQVMTSAGTSSRFEEPNIVFWAHRPHFHLGCLKYSMFWILCSIELLEIKCCPRPQASFCKTFENSLFVSSAIEIPGWSLPYDHLSFCFLKAFFKGLLMLTLNLQDEWIHWGN